MLLPLRVNAVLFVTQRPELLDIPITKRDFPPADSPDGG